MIVVYDYSQEGNILLENFIFVSKPVQPTKSWDQPFNAGFVHTRRRGTRAQGECHCCPR